MTLDIISEADCEKFIYLAPMHPISTISLVLYFIAICLMLGGMIYYIVVGSKGELNPMKAVVFIGMFVLAGMIVATIATMVQ